MAPLAATVELPFREIWLADFEFGADDGERPAPRCLVARELRTGREVRLFEDELRVATDAPYGVGRDALLVAFYASAEMGCHLALGWPMPENVLDLFAEFRCLTNGLSLPCGAGLLGALAYFGLDAIAAVEKEEMQRLALRGGPWSSDEKAALLDYCATDVDALERLLSAMLPTVDLGRALLRGRYMKAAAVMEHNGIPVDAQTLATLRAKWSSMQQSLISEIDSQFGVFDGTTFKAERWAAWLAARGIAWPHLPTGALALDDDTFREMARIHPEVAPLRELRHALSQMRLDELAVGADGRNRCLVSAFRARTSRNQPSPSRFIFGPAVWLRSLITPAPGRAIAYVDWSQQEWGIAAALSHDSAMMEAYTSGDPYLTFAKQAGAVPADGTKETHGAARERFKACALAIMYGMGADSFAQRIGATTAEARALLAAHRRTYPDFWRWSDGALDHAMLHGWLRTVFGWRIQVGVEANPRSLRNFLVQGNGAEMLRLACCYCVERDVKLLAPVHDALLVEGPLDEIEETVATTQETMAEASDVVLKGFRLRSDVKVVRHPDRYVDPRGERMWSQVQSLLVDSAQPVHERPGAPFADGRVAMPVAASASEREPVHGRSPVPSSFSPEREE